MPADSRPLGRLVSRPAAVLATVVLLVILLGCMSISIGKFSGTTDGTTTSDGVYCQEGEVSVPANSVRDIYFPAPYAHTPNLEISDTFHHSELLDQKADSFRVRNTAGYAITVSWKARGTRASVAAPVLEPPAPVPSESTEPLGRAR
jgi:hypothetical protein